MTATLHFLTAASSVLFVLFATTSSPAGAVSTEGVIDGNDCAADAKSVPVDYLIVGAGGAGIQLALFLHKYKYSFAILEKEDTAGSFWTRFPVFGELISVNKWVRNETQRLRYDWHSMLEAPLSMSDITDEYFPAGRDWHQYMNRVADESGINNHIEYGVEVAQIAADGTPCVTLSNGSKRCARRRVFVGTGLREKSEPYLQAMGGIPYSRMKKEFARHRRVCILGNGNAGFEIAQNVFGAAERVTLFGKYPFRLSSVTRYTGDVRVKFLQVIENFHGKLLDSVDKFDAHVTQRDLDRTTAALDRILNTSQLETLQAMIRTASWLKEFQCETLAIATGFRSEVPGMQLQTRFPPTNEWYSSTSNPLVHYIGWLMHEADFRKGAGGFLSGYRYLIRNLFLRVREEDNKIEYPHKTLTKEEVVAHVIARCQTADDLIILQDGVVIKDAFYPVNEEEDIYHYYEGISYQFHKKVTGRDDVMYLYFAWGDGRRVQNVFDGIIRYSDTLTLINFFLHPVIEAKGLIRDVHEDLEMAWNNSAYVSAIEKTTRAALEGDLSLFRTRQSHSYSRSTVNQTESGYYEPAKLKIPVRPTVVSAMRKAVYNNGAEQDMTMLQASVKQWIPSLFEFNA